MKYKSKTLEELARKSGLVSGKCALVGFDGFVDKIMSAVDRREGRGRNFQRIPTIEQFAQRIASAAGKSTNIELYRQQEKLGGNGPIMAHALLETGMNVKYIGSLGRPQVHPVFEEFAGRTDAVSLCQPGLTTAIEFEDGKIMLGETASLDDINYRGILKTVGEGKFIDAISRADLVALVNWTMIPQMSAIFAAIIAKILPNIGPKEGGRYFFIDLADPEKRTDGDIKSVLATIKRFSNHGHVTLGLNLKEAQRVFQLTGNKPPASDEEGLKTMARRLCQELDIHTVVIHPRDSAVCAHKGDAWWTPGPFEENPVIETGAGDHFNAGYATAQIIGLSPPACLTVAVAASDACVRFPLNLHCKPDKRLPKWPASFRWR